MSRSLEIESPKIENSKTRLLINSPYLISDNPSGVNDLISDLMPHLKKELTVRLSGPDKKNVNNHADFVLGRAVSLSGKSTQADVSVVLWGAENLLLTTTPDAILLEEPLAGNSAHRLKLSTPKRQDGSSLPAFIGQFHSTSETLDLSTQIALLAFKYFRFFEFNKYGFPKGLTPGLMNTVMGDLDGRIAVTHATANNWQAIYGPCDFEIIPNSINTDVITPFGPKIERWIKEGDSPIIFATGRHDHRKRMDLVIKAFALLLTKFPNARLKIGGHGKETDNLKKLVHELRLDRRVRGTCENGNTYDHELVEFLGVLKFGELVKAYRTADVVLAASDRGEGWGRIGPQGNAAGKPSVVSNIPGHLEAIQGLSFVWLFESGNVLDLARATNEVLKIPKERRIEEGIKAHNEIEDRYSASKIAKRTVSFIEECVRKHGKPRHEEWPKKKRKKMVQSGDIFKVTRKIKTVFFRKK